MANENGIDQMIPVNWHSGSEVQCFFFYSVTNGKSIVD